MPNFIKNCRALGALSILALAIALPSVSSAEGKKRFKPGNLTIAQIAQSDPENFSTLVEALGCTDLVGAVANEEAELTVFAPTNDAFANLLGGTPVCDLDKEVLTNILLYHVVDERRPSPSVINGRNKKIMMLNGDYVFPDGKGKTTIVDGSGNTSTIIAPDQLASNGIVHVINAVLLP